MHPTDSNFHQGFCSTKKWNERYVLVAPPAIETISLILSSLNVLLFLISVLFLDSSSANQRITSKNGRSKKPSSCILTFWTDQLLCLPPQGDDAEDRRESVQEKDDLNKRSERKLNKLLNPTPPKPETGQTPWNGTGTLPWQTQTAQQRKGLLPTSLYPPAYPPSPPPSQQPLLHLQQHHLPLHPLSPPQLSPHYALLEQPVPLSPSGFWLQISSLHSQPSRCPPGLPHFPLLFCFHVLLSIQTKEQSRVAKDLAVDTSTRAGPDKDNPLLYKWKALKCKPHPCSWNCVYNSMCNRVVYWGEGNSGIKIWGWTNMALTPSEPAYIIHKYEVHNYIIPEYKMETVTFT